MVETKGSGFWVGCGVDLPDEKSGHVSSSLWERVFGALAYVRVVRMLDRSVFCP